MYDRFYFVLSICFFFEFYRYHHYLHILRHCCPTRGSSDLGAQVRGGVSRSSARSPASARRRSPRRSTATAVPASIGAPRLPVMRRAPRLTGTGGGCALTGGHPSPRNPR